MKRGSCWTHHSKTENYSDPSMLLLGFPFLQQLMDEERKLLDTPQQNRELQRSKLHQDQKWNGRRTNRINRQGTLKLQVCGYSGSLFQQKLMDKERKLLDTPQKKIMNQSTGNSKFAVIQGPLIVQKLTGGCREEADGCSIKRFRQKKIKKNHVHRYNKPMYKVAD